MKAAVLYGRKTPLKVEVDLDAPKAGEVLVKVVAIGNSRSPAAPAASFLGEKTLKGSAYGSARPRVDLSRLIDLYRQKNSNSAS